MNLWIFLTYSFFGFVLEVVYARLTRSEKPDRKCLLVLPLCPVYGLAALGILALPKAVEAVPLLLFLRGAAWRRWQNMPWAFSPAMPLG